MKRVMLSWDPYSQAMSCFPRILDTENGKEIKLIISQQLKGSRI